MTFQPSGKRNQPSKALRRQVRDVFDAADLIDACMRDDFSDIATKVEVSSHRWGSYDRFYWHADNGSDVLAVAHLDTVQRDRSCTVVDTHQGPLALSGALDDRLGVYVITRMLPALGINVDLLLTTDEESACSTAVEFETSKTYNHVIEFDRGGTDVVMYQYETKALALLVGESGARVGSGSYSDIADLEHLGCAAFNWGVGYADYHSPRSHAWLTDTFRMVARYVKFHRQNEGQHLEGVDYCRERSKFLSDGWEDDTETIEADCGHMVDLFDASSYDVLPGGSIVCPPCGYQFGVTA